MKPLHDIISPDLPTSNLTPSDDRRPDSPPTSETVPYCTVTLQCGILTHPLGLTPFSHSCISFPPSNQSLPSHPSPIKLPSPLTPLPPTNHHPPSASSSSPPHRQKARFFRHALTGYSADGRRKEKRAAWPVHSPASASAPALAIRPLQNPHLVSWYAMIGRARRWGGKVRRNEADGGGSLSANGRRGPIRCLSALSLPAS